MKKSAAMKIGLGAAAAVALTLGGMTPAFAATIPVGPDQVAPVEIGGLTGDEPGYNYHTWHIGSAGVGQEEVGYLSFNFDDAAGITLNPRATTGSPNATQLFKGNHIADINETEPLNAEAFEAFLNGLSVEVASGTVHFQIAGQYNGVWTTFRPVTAHGSAVASQDLGNWIGTSSATATPRPLMDYFSDTESFLLYGVGVNTDSGVPAVVSTITFGGNTYDFTTAAAPTPGAPTPGAPAPVAPTPPAKIDTAA